MNADPIVREQTIARYLARKLSPGEREAFESHYLICQECFEELRAAELLLAALGSASIERTRNNDVTVVRFTASSELTAASGQLDTLYSAVKGDTKVLIDLSRVSRIDSAGLGELMRCFTHTTRNAGALKLVNPSAQVKRVLSMTRIDSIVPTFEDERAALRSFQ